LAYCSSQCLAIVDVNGDGVLDAVSCQSSIRVVDGATGEKMPGKWGGTGTTGHSLFSIYDIDDDGNLELITCWNQDGGTRPAKVWDMGRWALDATLDAFAESPMMADVVGDSRLEIIGGSDWKWDPDDGSKGVKIYNQNYELIHTIHAAAIATTLVQDIDNDGLNELVIISSDGVLKAYETTAVAPTPRVRTDSLYYSERNMGVGVYVPPIGMSQDTGSEYNYRKEITIDHNLVYEVLTDFPLLVNFGSDNDLAIKAQNDGDDIFFEDFYGTKLNHEIEYFDGATGELVAWVRLPRLDSDTDTVLYMYYGNDSASNQENVEGTWDSNFMAVHHLEETSGTVYDSTSGNYDGTIHGNPNQNVIGRIGGADSFDGIDDHITLPSVFSTENQFTMEAWINPQIGARYFISQWSNNNGAFLQYFPLDLIQCYINGGSDGIYNTPLDDWYYVVLTFDGSTATFYKNAAISISMTSDIPDWPSESMFIGDRSEGGREFHGIIDEVRFSNIARSAGWVETCYNNQNDPSDFYIVGSEEGVNEEPIVYNEQPENMETDVPVYRCSGFLITT